MTDHEPPENCWTSPASLLSPGPSAVVAFTLVLLLGAAIHLD